MSDLVWHRALTGLVLFASLQAAAQSPKIVAFANVSVIPMTENRVLPNQTVVITGDRITAVGPAKTTPVPEGATRVDGQGKYLMPGLAEMHGHIPGGTAPREFVDNVLFLYVATGVTTVRGMQGAPGQLDLREASKRGEIVAPNLYLAGPQFSGNSVKSAGGRDRARPPAEVGRLGPAESAGGPLGAGLRRDGEDREGSRHPLRRTRARRRRPAARHRDGPGHRSITSMATSSSSTAARSRSTTRRSRISSSARRRPARGSCQRWWCGRRCRDR